MKYNIALSGTFNVENYGDLMFPEVFKMAMKKRGLDFNLFLFSPSQSGKKALDDNTTVYSIDEIDKIHSKTPFDAVIVGGGALVHYSKIPVKLPGNDYFSDYKIHDSWYTPIEFAVRNNIKVLFNLPQVPYNFSQTTNEISKKAFESLDYISLRDNISKEYISQLYENGNPPEINVFPDSVCCLPELISADYLSDIKNKIIDFDGEYAVIQFNPQMPVEDEKDLLKVIRKLKSVGLEVLLLPLGYTHNDDTVLLEFNKKYNCGCKLFSQKLNIFEMAAILADCNIYIGASFHGAITAIAYGKKAISYNYISPKNKNKEIFRMYGIDDFVAETASDVYNILEKLLDNTVEYSPCLDEVVSLVDLHFDKLFSLITKPYKKQANYPDFISPLLNLIPEIVDLEIGKTSLELQQQLSQSYISDLEKINNSYKDHINDLEKINFSYKNEVEELRKAIDELTVTIENQNSSIQNLNSEILAANNSFAEIQSSFFWKITYPVRKVLQKLKDTLSLYPPILEIFIFMKGFLRGGIKGGKEKVLSYRKFIGKESKFSSKISKRTRRKESSFVFSKNIKFSILVPLYNTPIDFLEEMIDSVRNQTYKNWELCLADGSNDEHNYVEKYCINIANRDKRIKYKKLTQNKGISENTNECIKIATGDYIALFDHDDILHPSALYECMKVICEHDADYVYTDEAVFLGSDISNIISYHFKPDYAYYNLIANNYICHFSVFRASLIDKVGMFRDKYDGSQDHDMILRLTDAANKVIHIPKILYFWRSHSNSVAMDINSKAYAINAGISAVHDFLESKNIQAEVSSSPAFPAIYRVKYKIADTPKISIIIPNKNNLALLQLCVKSITEKTKYSNYEIIIVDNQSSEKQVFEYYDTIKNNGRIKILSYNKAFNYSAMINYAASKSNGDYLLLLDSDTQVITPEWIEELLMHAQFDNVGAVGAKLLLPNDSIQHGGIIIGLGSLHIAANSHLGVHKENLGYMGKMFYAQNVTAVTSACLMIKKSDFISVGGFDEKLNMAFNDVDFCLKLRDKGLSNIFNPFAVLYHHQNQSFYDETIFLKESEYFKHKWESTLAKGDPYYNPNFSLDNSYIINF